VSGPAQSAAGAVVGEVDRRFSRFSIDGQPLLSKGDIPLDSQEWLVQQRYWVSRREVETRLQAQGWDRPWLMG
jgi:hypothetical protein